MAILLLSKRKRAGSLWKMRSPLNLATKPQTEKNTQNRKLWVLFLLRSHPCQTRPRHKRGRGNTCCNYVVSYSIISLTWHITTFGGLWANTGKQKIHIVLGWWDREVMSHSTPLYVWHEQWAAWMAFALGWSIRSIFAPAHQRNACHICNNNNNKSKLGYVFFAGQCVSMSTWKGGC